jgi:hypothetical protein
MTALPSFNLQRKLLFWLLFALEPFGCASEPDSGQSLSVPEFQAQDIQNAKDFSPLLLRSLEHEFHSGSCLSRTSLLLVSEKREN